MKTLLELGCVQNKESAGAENSILLNAAIDKRRGGSYLATRGAWYFDQSIAVGRGYSCRIYSEDNGQWRVRSDDIVRFMPTQTFPSGRYMVEFGRPGGPNADYRFFSRDNTVERIGFDFGKRKREIGGVAFYLCEQGRVISCHFNECLKGILVETEKSTWNMNHHIESCKFGICDQAIAIQRTTGGSAHAGVNIFSCAATRCGNALWQKNVDVPTNIIGFHVQNSSRWAFAFDHSQANIMGCYLENPIKGDIWLKNSSAAHLIGWNRADKSHVDQTSKFENHHAGNQTIGTSPK